MFCHYEIGLTRGDPWLYKSHWGESVSLFHLVSSCVYGIIFSGDMKCYPAFWMMKYMFTGVVLSILLKLVFFHLSDLGKYIFLCFILHIFVLYSDPYYCCVIYGFVLSFIEKSIFRNNLKKISLIIFVLALLLANYSNSFQGRMQTIIRAFAAFILTFSFMDLYDSTKLLFCNFERSFINKGAMFLGRISFGIYCIHLLFMCTFSSWWYQNFSKYDALVQCGVNIALSLFFTLAASFFFYYFVEVKMFNYLWSLYIKNIRKETS